MLSLYFKGGPGNPGLPGAQGESGPSGEGGTPGQRGLRGSGGPVVWLSLTLCCHCFNFGFLKITNFTFVFMYTTYQLLARRGLFLLIFIRTVCLLNVY